MTVNLRESATTMLFALTGLCVDLQNPELHTKVSTHHYSKYSIILQHLHFYVWILIFMKHIIVFARDLI